MSRIETTFKQLALAGRKALIPFITTGDPAIEFTVPLMHTLVEAGADIIELGVPFSDPMADGPVIQRSSERALAHNVGLKEVLAVVAEFRQTNAVTPIVLMGYANPIEAMGYKPFAKRAAESGVDGVLTVDYPPEESINFVQHLYENGIDPIFLLSPTTREERSKKIIQMARGFIYYVSLKGVTGADHLDLAEVEQKIGQIRANSSLPIAVGFGIRDADTAAAMAKFADAVVIGSRIVQQIEAASQPTLLSDIAALLHTFRDALDQDNKRPDPIAVKHKDDK